MSTSPAPTSPARPGKTDEPRAWPPEYSVRVSARAKYPRLRVLPGVGLEVVLPRRMRQENAAEIVERHRDWICKTLDRVCGADREQAGEPFPTAVSLRGGMDVHAIVRAGEPLPEGLAVRLKAAEDEDALQELRNWTRAHAARVLADEVAFLAGEHGLSYSALRFRRQKSRWGSCTAKGSLSLNTCLIFLPPDMARHVILHELAHTRHMNHGQGFWKLLFAMEPDALKLDKRLRSAWKYVPAWIWG